MHGINCVDLGYSKTDLRFMIGEWPILFLVKRELVI